jgi:hypothetical protein
MATEWRPWPRAACWRCLTNSLMPFAYEEEENWPEQPPLSGSACRWAGCDRGAATQPKALGIVACPQLITARWVTELRTSGTSTSPAPNRPRHTTTPRDWISAQSIAVFHDRTKGWPALCLACLLPRGSSDPVMPSRTKRLGGWLASSSTRTSSSSRSTTGMSGSAIRNCSPPPNDELGRRYKERRPMLHRRAAALETKAGGS